MHFRPLLPAALLTLLALVALLMAPPPLNAMPSGGAQAAVVPYLAPCGPFNNCPSSVGPLIPLPNGTWWRVAAVNAGQEFNDALAVVALRPVPGQPLDRLLQLGVRASMDRLVSLTEDGLPGTVLARERLPLHFANASASFNDLLQFHDPTLPLGVPIQVSLTWTLSSDHCGATRANCRLQDPTVPPVLPPDTYRAQADAYTAVSSRIELPGGPSVVADSFVHAASHPLFAYSAYEAQLVVGRPHTLTHSFTVANGVDHNYTLAATAQITLDASHLVDWNVVGQPDSQRPLQRAVNLLDYDDTLHLTALQGTDPATGQALTSLRMVTSLGLAVLPETLPAVPEAPALVLMLAGLLCLGLQRWRRGLPLSALMFAPLFAQAHLPAPEVWVQGLVCCNENGAVSYDDRVSHGTVGGSAQTLGAGNAKGQAIAGFGHLQLLGESAGGFANTGAGFVDQITLLLANPAWLGDVGLLQWHFDLTGAVAQYDLGAEGFGSVQVQATALAASAGTGRKFTQWINAQDPALDEVRGDDLPWRQVAV